MWYFTRKTYFRKGEKREVVAFFPVSIGILITQQVFYDLQIVEIACQQLHHRSLKAHFQP